MANINLRWNMYETKEKIDSICLDLDPKDSKYQLDNLLTSTCSYNQY